MSTTALLQHIHHVGGNKYTHESAILLTFRKVSATWPPHGHVRVAELRHALHAGSPISPIKTDSEYWLTARPARRNIINVAMPRYALARPRARFRILAHGSTCEEKYNHSGHQLDISFGSERTFKLWDEATGTVESVKMPHGSAIALSTATNVRCKHAVLPETGAVPRVSFVLRDIKTLVAASTVADKVAAAERKRVREH